MKSVRIRSFSGPYFPAFGLNTERYNVSLRIQSKRRKIRTRKTPNTDTFYAVYTLGLYSSAAFLVDNPYNIYPQGQKLQSNIYSQIKHQFSISYDFAVLWNPFLPKTVSKIFRLKMLKF